MMVAPATRTFCRLQDLNLLEVAAGVDHEAVTAGLTGGGTAERKVEGQAEVACSAEDVGDIFGGIGADQAGGHEQVVGCVVEIARRSSSETLDSTASARASESRRLRVSS